jgi:hypothetical protein
LIATTIDHPLSHQVDSVPNACPFTTPRQHRSWDIVRAILCTLPTMYIVSMLLRKNETTAAAAAASFRYTCGQCDWNSTQCDGEPVLVVVMVDRTSRGSCRKYLEMLNERRQVNWLSGSRETTLQTNPRRHESLVKPSMPKSSAAVVCSKRAKTTVAMLHGR